MSDPLVQTDNQGHQAVLDKLSAALGSGRMQLARRMLHGLHPAEIAHLLESLPRAQRNILWEFTDPEDDGEILINTNEEVRASLIDRMDEGQLVEALDGMAVDDVADILDDLPNRLTETVLESMSAQQRRLVEEVRLWPEDSAGGLMDTDVVTVRADVTLEVVQRFLRMRGSLPAHTDALYVLDRYGHYRGSLKLSHLLTEDPEQLVAEVIENDSAPIPVDMPDTQVAALFEDRDLVSAPVVNEANELIGRITIDDVVDVIREDAEHSILSMAGLDEDEDLFAPVLKSAPRRGLWLGVNLITALIASWVVGLFQATINDVVALAVLMPVVASMGGIAGSQTLTLIIRAQALEQISRSNARSLLGRELAIGALNGIAWALLIAVVALFWFDNQKLGMVIAIAVFINMLFAALAGFSIPLILKRLSVDPALAGSVVLTTVTDVVGFLAFLGLGSILLVAVT